MTKSTAERALKLMFPTARLSRVTRGGVVGWQVETPLGITYRTFENTPDVFARCVRFTLPMWRQRVGLA